MNEERWKKSQEIKFYIDLFSNSVYIRNFALSKVMVKFPRILLIKIYDKIATTEASSM